jgi:single-strand DNA-binding protein
MSRIENSCRFVGYTGDNVKITNFDNGNKLGRIPLAVNKSYKDKEGQKQTTTTWINLVARNNVADIFDKYIPKGTSIIVETEYSSRPYEAKDGTTRYSNEFFVNQVKINSSKNENSHNAQHPQQPGLEEDNDDLPF